MEDPWFKAVQTKVWVLAYHPPSSEWVLCDETMEMDRPLQEEKQHGL